MKAFWKQGINGPLKQTWDFISIYILKLLQIKSLIFLCDENILQKSKWISDFFLFYFPNVSFFKVGM